MALFTLPQMISRLTKGFVKVTGRKPDGLEKIKIKQEALERIKQQDKVVDMEGNVLDVTKPIIGGKQEGLERVAKTLEANQKRKLNTFKNLDDNKKLNADEIEELEEELGNVNDPDGPDLYEAHPEFDGTAGSAKKILKDSVEYEQSMFEQYKAGKLDPTPKPVSSLDREIKEAYNQAVREGRLQNIRLKDGRRIESEDDFREYIDELNEDNNFNFANGGRIGYKDGPDVPGRRKFMKIMGGLATIPFIGKFFKGAKTAAPAVEKAAEVAGQAPSYFFDLAAKIKMLGRMSDGPAERIKEYSMKGKDGKSEFLLSEDIGTGEMQIKKIGKENDDMITEVQTMEYTPGSSMADETTKGIPADNYEEFTEYNSRIYKDEFNDPQIETGIKVKEIIEEVKDQAPSIKKADGGIAMMLGE